MRQAGQPEKEREASGHARDEELGLVHEQVEVGNPNEAENAAERCARDGIKEKAQQAVNPPARRRRFAWETA